MRQALSDDKSPVKSDGEIVDLANPDSSGSFDSQSTVPNSEKSKKVNSSQSTNSNPSSSLLSSPLAPSQAAAPMTDLTMIVTTPVNPPEQSCDKSTENLEGCLLQEQNEPDIVKSAKPRNLTPPNTLDTKQQQLELPTVLDPPVAPPRRKKKPKEIVVSNVCYLFLFLLILFFFLIKKSFFISLKIFVSKLYCIPTLRLLQKQHISHNLLRNKNTEKYLKYYKHLNNFFFFFFF